MSEDRLEDFDLSKITGREPPLEFDPCNQISKLEAEVEELRGALRDISQVTYMEEDSTNPLESELLEANLKVYDIAEKALAAQEDR